MKCIQHAHTHTPDRHKGECCLLLSFKDELTSQRKCLYTLGNFLLFDTVLHMNCLLQNSDLN